MGAPRPWPAFPLFDLTDRAAEDLAPAIPGLDQTSLEAWARVEPHRRPICDRIVAIVRGRGSIGATLSELAVVLGKEKSSFSGRSSELVTAGELQVLRDAAGREISRDGCRVLVTAATA